MSEDLSNAESQDAPAPHDADESPFPLPPLEEIERGFTLPGEDERRAG